MRPRSRDLLKFPRFFLFLSRILTPPPRVQQQNDLQACKHKTIYASQLHFFPPSLPPFFILPFFSSSRLTLSNKHLLTQRRHHEVEVSVTIQTRTSRHGSLHVYKPALLLVEEGIVLLSSRSLFPLSFYFAHSRASPSQQSSSGTVVCTILAGFSRLSTLSRRSLFPPLSLSYLSRTSTDSLSLAQAKGTVS